MYYEEKIINDVLCHRGTPDGDWRPFTAEQLTTKLLTAEAKIAKQLLMSSHIETKLFPPVQHL